MTAFGRWAELPLNAHIVNRGVGGDTTERASNWLAEIERLPAKQTVVMLGINDILHSHNLNRSIGRYEEIIDRPRSSGKHAIVQSTLSVASWLQDSTQIKCVIGRKSSVMPDNSALIRATECIRTSTDQQRYAVEN